MHIESMQFGTFAFSQLSLAVWGLILLALVFDFLNGFHDAANSVATVVSTRVLSPQAAVLWAAFFNFIAFLVFPLGVAKTISGTLVFDRISDSLNEVIAATLIAACLWNLLTWYLALPTSSTHALMGGLVGAGLAKTFSLGVLHWEAVGLTVLFIFLSPLIGALCGLLMAVAVSWACWKVAPRRVDQVFRKGQLLSAAWFSLNHGGNDAQKTMGIIFLLLAATQTGGASAGIPQPFEVVLACHLAIGLGTMFGGWRIVKTMGQKIIKLRPVDGFCAENGAGLAVALATSVAGIPVSTTHTITGAIVGVGSLKRLSAVRWGVAGRVVWAWVLTIPGAALMAVLSWWGLQLLRWLGSLLWPA
jgi:inorganic phosphate transporter, PiT family